MAEKRQTETRCLCMWKIWAWSNRLWRIRAAHKCTGLYIRWFAVETRKKTTKSLMFLGNIYVLFLCWDVSWLCFYVCVFSPIERSVYEAGMMSVLLITHTGKHSFLTRGRAPGIFFSRNPRARSASHAQCLVKVTLVLTCARYLKNVMDYRY